MEGDVSMLPVFGDDCDTMSARLGQITGEYADTIKPVLKLLDDYTKKQQITDGLTKVVRHFNCALRRENDFFEHLHTKESRGKSSSCTFK